MEKNRQLLTEEVVQKWSVDDVSNWLQEQGCDLEIIERLQKEKVDGEVFSKKILPFFFFLIFNFFI